MLYMIVKDLVYILTEGVGSIFLLKNQVKRKNYFVASLERKWLNCKDTTKSKPGQNPKRQKNLLNTKTVWEILLTHGLAEAEGGRGRGCVTPSLGTWILFRIGVIHCHFLPKIVNSQWC